MPGGAALVAQRQTGAKRIPVAATHTLLAAELAELEKKVTEQDGELRQVIAILRALLQPDPKPRRKIGY